MTLAAKEAYERASECDRRGEEAEAIPLYEQALALGLRPEDRKDALLGLGSSLRKVGRLSESVDLLRAAVQEFPDLPALRLFLALSLHSHGSHTEAVTTLLQLTLRYAPLDGYERALEAELKELSGR